MICPPERKKMGKDMTKKPKVSVLMPAYNAEKYIAMAIESIIVQTFTDFEFLIINDGSADKTADIIRSFDDARIRFVDNPKNQGLVAVLNQGVDLARGEYIARMDADDISLPARLAKQVVYMDANLDVGVLGTNFTAFGSRSWDSDYLSDQPRVLEFLGSCHLCHPTVLMRKSVLDAHNLRYNPEFTACEDYELWSRLVMVTKIVNLPDVLLKYRWHDSNVSVRQRDIQEKNDARVKQNILSFLTCDKKLSRKLQINIKGQKTAAPILLFGFIPLLRFVSKGRSKKTYLFYVIPFTKFKNDWILLFHVLPIFKIGE